MRWTPLQLSAAQVEPGGPRAAGWRLNGAISMGRENLLDHLAPPDAREERPDALWSVVWFGVKPIDRGTAERTGITSADPLLQGRFCILVGLAATDSVNIAISEDGHAVSSIIAPQHSGSVAGGSQVGPAFNLDVD